MSTRLALVLALLSIACSDGGSPSDAAELRFVALSAGATHSCGRTGPGATYCWGSNFDGQLGAHTDTEANPIPLQLVVRPLALTEVSGGASFSCGLLNTGAPLCWGQKETSPRLLRGGGIFSNISAGLFICGVRDDARVICWDNPDAQPYSIEGPGFVRVSVGGMACGIASDATAWCWQPGETVAQQVSENLTFTSITAGLGHTCGIAPDRQAYCWGSNSHGQLGNLKDAQATLPDTVFGYFEWADISAGNHHTCGVTTTGGGFCWGAAGSGQLGYNSPPPLGGYFSSPVRVRGGDLPEGTVVWRTISAGGRHSCGATIEGLTFCWGENGNGQLGSGDTDDSVGPVALGPSE